jgi:hypothetical protein
MKFGGLSEKEVKAISRILEEAKIEYQVLEDQGMQDFNQQSMQNDLRHLSSPNISTDILAIEVKDEAFNSMSDETKAALLDHGITNEIPDGLEFSEKESEPEPIQNVIVEGNRRGMGFYGFFTIVVIIIIRVLINWIEK